MARLPTSANLSQPGSLRSGAPIASVDTSGFARGVGAFGAALTDISADMKRRSVVQDGSTADGLAIKALNDFERQFDADTEYDTFGKRFDSGAKSIVDSAAAHIRDPQARQVWASNFEKSVLSSRNRVLDLGAKRIRESRLVDHKAALEGYQSVIADPLADDDARKRARANAEAAIDAAYDAGDLTPSEADTWRENVLRGGDFVYGQRLIEANPEIITGKLPAAVSDRAGIAMQFFEAKGYNKVQAAGIVGNLIAESELRPSGAVGDAGTAFGVAQWREERFNNLRRFASSRGKSWQDFETQLEFVDFELRNTEKSAYSNLMRAETIDDATAAMIGYERPQGWTSVNPRGGMHYDKRLKFAAQAAGETIRPDWFTNQSPEDQFRLEQMAASRQAEIANAQAKEQAAAQVGAKDNFQLRINTADPTLTRDDILSSTLIDDGDKASLISSYDTKMEDIRETALAIQAFSQGRLSIDPYSSDGRKVVDGVFTEFAASVPDESLSGMTDEIVRQTGIVPSMVQNSIRKGLGSKDVGEVATAAQTASRLYAIDPAAFGRRDGGGDVSKSVIGYDHYVQDLGYSPEEAAAKLMEMNDPEVRRQRQALLDTKEVKDTLKNIDDGDVSRIFDPGLFSFAPSVGETDAARAAIVSDYKDLMTEAIVEAGGDMDLAEKLAADRFSRVYNVSKLNLAGEGVVVKYPPEVAYPAGADGTHEYIRNQALQALSEDGYEGVDEIALEVDPDGMTEADIRNGRPAKYILHFKRDGAWFRHNLPFFAIPEAEADTPDLSGNISRMESNRSAEVNRQRIVEGGAGESPLAEMAAAGREAERLTSDDQSLTTERGKDLASEIRGVIEEAMTADGDRLKELNRKIDDLNVQLFDAEGVVVSRPDSLMKKLREKPEQRSGGGGF